MVNPFANLSIFGTLWAHFCHKVGPVWSHVEAPPAKQKDLGGRKHPNRQPMDPNSNRNQQLATFLVGKKFESKPQLALASKLANVMKGPLTLKVCWTTSR